MQTNVHEAEVRHGASAILAGNRDLEILRRSIARAGGHVSGRLHGAPQQVVIVPQALAPTGVVSLGSTVVLECSPGGRRDLVVVEPWRAKVGPELESWDGSRLWARIVAVNPGGTTT